MAENKPGEKGPPAKGDAQPSEWESTRGLLLRIKSGDREALDRLYARYRPRLRTWASQRLPRWARDGKDTDDLVQDTLAATLTRIDAFEFRHEGAFNAYLRQAVNNKIRTLKKRAVEKPGRVDLASDQADPTPSPLEQTIGKQAYERYESALEDLPQEARAAVILKIEMGFTYEQIAQALEKPTANAARMVVTRALFKLTKGMGHGG
jgi:RNA polymerase sigma-70 factor (ECF subfamily)